FRALRLPPVAGRGITDEDEDPASPPVIVLGHGYWMSRFGGDPGAVCKAVNKCVSQISDPFRKYILMPSCDLPIDTPLRNAKEFLSCADRFSR
ncbi:MAG: uroporphyrinogen decarboxylase family protein, partial [Thermodesulfovibrionales bacterium]